MSATTNGKTGDRQPRRTPTGISADQLTSAVPLDNTVARFAKVSFHQTRELGTAAVARVPGLGPKVDRPRRQPLRSGALRMNQWWRRPYGTDAKPDSVGQIPWDYVEAQQDEIPFLGLREYWYPALRSKELRNNVALPTVMLGDNLVFFRDAEGRARALKNRCPHRGPLLSLGQVGVLEPGTITCRYHGMTFDGDGECVAFLADGPDSPACGKVRARHYPTEEVGGVVWVWMGDDDPPPLMDALPRARDVFQYDNLFRYRLRIPISHLNILDNAVDMTHTGVLHRTCLLFSGQKPFGQLDVNTIGDGQGLHVAYKDPGPQAGSFSIDQIEWYLPNFVYHDHDDLGGGLGAGFFWFVPRDVGSFTGFFVLGLDDAGGPVRNTLKRALFELMWSRWYPLPGSVSSCLDGGDLPMMASQGRVPRWDQDSLARPDGGVARARRLVTQAHAAEVTRRRERAEATGTSVPRIQRPVPAGV